ncbi:hypothetical protein [Engelhardtia mirabilis]|uniref:hypothetical protein n=1 Tax=Engelhardtia mirabilis TaxID=2528011 RepID=UPI0011A5783B
MTVLLVLVSLLVLCTPFLWTASNTDRTSARLLSETQTRIALDTAARHARHALGRSHPALDSTRFSDGPEELNPDDRDVAELLDAADRNGVMWGHEVTDLSGLVDLNSASPLLLANLLGQAGYLTQPIDAGKQEFDLAGGRGLRSSGLLRIGGELVNYTSREGSKLGGMTRGLFGTAEPCGFWLASGHGAGAVVTGYDGWGLAQWRMSRGMQDARGLTVGDIARELPAFIPAALAESDPSLGQPDLQAVLEDRVLSDLTATLGRTTTLHGGVAAGDRWQYPVRLLNDLNAGTDCRLLLSDGRWVNPGTTVMIRQGGTSELGLVRGAGGGAAVLTETVVNSYDAGEAEVLVLARRPVNINSASPEVLSALFENLKLVGVNQRISRAEAEELAVRVMTQRPFVGFEDFLQRIVLPAAGIASWDEVKPLSTAVGEEQKQAALERFLARLEERDPPFLSQDDARALYTNAVCATDVSLEFSTAPFSFSSRDTYDIELRASVNAPSGVQRLAGRRRQIEWVAPQTDLLRLWTAQEDFDESLRLGRAAPGWGTGPITTTLHDTGYGSTPPPRSRVQFMTGELDLGDDQAVPFARSLFPSRDESGFAKPWHVRLDEEGPRAGAVTHFDLDETALEGHDTSEEPWQRSASALGLFDAGLLAPFTLSFWAKPTGTTAGRLLDVAGDDPNGDRVTLFVEEESNELVLRVLDGPGDHPATAFPEYTEARLELGDSGALPADTWSHVEATVSGTRPDQLLLRVDGFSKARTPGMTRLTSALGTDASLIQVESTEGFPPFGPIRIGDEVIEATVLDDDTLQVAFTDSGELAGFGGRLAREIAPPTATGTYDNEGLFKDTSYPAGTPVHVYGYSLPIDSNVPAGGLRLRGDLGAFAAGRVVGLEGTSNPLGDLLSAEIELTLPGGGFVTGALQFGRGWDSADNDVTGLRLAPVDAGQSTGDVMSAFSPDGGYAAVMQRIWVTNFVDEAIEDPEFLELIDTMTPVGGLEIVRYSGVDGDVLTIPQGGFGVDSSELARLGDQAVDLLGKIGGPKAFIVDWELVLGAQGFPSVGFDSVSNRHNRSIEWQTIVAPISIGVTGTAQSLLPPQPFQSEFVQITETGVDSGKSEWVRYDEIKTSGSGIDLVRSAPLGLLELFSAALNQITFIEERLVGSLQGGVGGPFVPEPAPLEPLAATVPAVPEPAIIEPAPSAAQISSGVFWAPEHGGSEAVEIADDLVYTRAVRTGFQHRGVLGTYSFEHSADVDVLPVFRVFDRRTVAGEVDELQHIQPSWGWPGAGDPVFLVDEDVEDIGSPGTIHRAVRPAGYLRYAWEDGPNLTVTADTPLLRSDEGFLSGPCYVAMREPLGVFGAPSADFGPNGNPANADRVDPRRISRLVKFPSGEMPRLATQVALGGDVAQSEDPVAMLVDEVFRRRTEVQAGQSLRGAAYILSAGLDDGDDAMLLSVSRLRAVRGHVPGTGLFGSGSGFDTDAGLMRIGSEIVAYTDMTEEGSLLLSVEGLGRGLLGTEAQAHVPGEPVHFLDHISVSKLTSSMSADDADIFVSDNSDMPREGTVLIGEELLHHTNKIDGLGMPARSTEPGAQDGKGAGLFRGRFGTEPDAHPEGAPVIHFQTRYWDRYPDDSDAPELQFLGLDLPQPDAWVRSVLVEQTEPSFGGVRTGLMIRTDPTVAWDADPEKTPGLKRYWLDQLAGRPAPVRAQASRVELRLFHQFEQGAFDPLSGSQGWKDVPVIEQVAIDYIAPGRVFERSDL